MGSANVDSSETSPFRIIPERGKVFEDSSKATGPEGRDVFRDDTRRPRLPDDAGKL